MGLISIIEYANKIGRHVSAVRQKAESGTLKAVKIGNVWAIDENEPYIDYRRKGKANMEKALMYIEENRNEIENEIREDYAGSYETSYPDIERLYIRVTVEDDGRVAITDSWVGRMRDRHHSERDGWVEIGTPISLTAGFDLDWGKKGYLEEFGDDVRVKMTEWEQAHEGASDLDWIDALTDVVPSISVARLFVPDDVDREIELIKDYIKYM